MFKNLDIKIKNITIYDFLSRCEEMEDIIMPVLKTKGYISNFYLEPIGCFVSGKNIFRFQIPFQKDNEVFDIPVSFFEKNEVLYLHDEIEINKDWHLYNEKNSLFNILKNIARTFESVEYYEFISKDSTLYQKNLFDNDKIKEEVLHKSKKIISTYKKENNPIFDYNNEDMER